MVEVEVAIRETKTFQLPMGMDREDKCMGAGIQASKLFKAPYINMLDFGCALPARKHNLQRNNGVL